MAFQPDLAKIVAALQCGRPGCVCAKGKQVHCPAHKDDRPSLSIVEKDGHILWHCHAGCSQEAVRDELRARGLLSAPDDSTHQPEGARRDGGRIIDAYDYCDKAGALLFQVVRYEPKAFTQRQPDGRGGWRYNLDGVQRVLYRLPELLSAPAGSRVYIVEGEKDADRIAASGLNATTNPGGAGKWRPEYSEALRGRHAVVLSDNDDPGRAHAQSVAQALHGIAVTVKCIELSGLPEKGDVSDWLAAGHTVAELQAIADAADFWRPEEHTGVDAPARTAAQMASVAGNEAYHLTDLGNAKRLVFQHGRDLRYCHPLHRWFVYDGRRWSEDAAGEVLRRAKETVKSMYAEAGQISDAEMRKNLVGWAMRSESAERIAAMVRLAESESQVVVRPEQLDADPWLLNCLNGTIDLRARQLRPHRREDLITRLAPVEFDPDAHLALWDETLAYAFPDLDVRAFVQSAVGYSATADISEEKFFMLIGPTSSGKTTIVEAVKAALGDYAATADIRSFLAAQDDRGPRSDIARLAGRRFIPSVEVDQGKRLAEGLVKMLSGGDTVVARRLYQEDFEFSFTGKVWIIANHAPRVRDDDDALWRRIVRIPSQQIPEKRRDKAVKERLRDPRLAGPAILAWIVKGATEWQQRGLDVPAAVATATDEYRKEMDVLQPFFESVCVFDPNAEVEARALREAYEGWCRENGERPLSGRTVGQRLRERGCESQKRAGGRRVWVGIGLVAAGTSGGSGGSGVKMEKFPYAREEESLFQNGATAATGATRVQNPPARLPDGGRSAATLQMGKDLGWPTLPLKPGISIAAGEENWRKFGETASMEELDLALLALERYKSGHEKPPGAVS